MSQQFYIAENGQQAGPFTIDELKEKNIHPDTLVWTEGIDSWTKAEYIPLLKEILRATPPPLPNPEKNITSQQVPPPPTPTPPPINTDKFFGYALASRRDRFFAVILESIILIIPSYIIFGDSDPFSFNSIALGAVFSAVLGAIVYPMWGGNIGHKIMGLQVISSENGEVQNNAKAGIIREGLKSVFSSVVIPVIWLLWDENKQNLYDKVANTYVVKRK